MPRRKNGAVGASVSYSSVSLLLLAISAMAPLGAGQSCGGRLNGQGILTSSNFNANNNPWGNLRVGGGARCQWTLTPDTGKLGNILFNVFDLAQGATLSIYLGTNTAAGVAPLTQYTGKGPAGGVVQFPSVVTLVFTDADLSLSRGFQLAFYSTERPAASFRRSLADIPSPGCGETLMGAGAVSSPGYPGNYPLNSKCSWTLTPCEPGAHITVHFAAMNLEAPFDYVTLVSGDLTEYGPYSGSFLPGDITAVAPITVAFVSDNEGSSNSGFSLQFSTVSTALASADPLASMGACEALCPANVTEDPILHCYAHDDPHMFRFDSTMPDDFQKSGVYYMYRHKIAPVSVQAAFQPCLNWPGAFCVCAVAVRYCDEVFVVDQCFTKVPVNGQSNKLYKAGTGSAMHIEHLATSSHGWTVTLPTGLRVNIDSTRQWIGNVDLYDSLANRGASEGMCRDLYRCGTSPNQYPRSYDSWLVPPEESLFTNWAQQAVHCKISKCGGLCPTLKQFDIPPGVLGMSDPNVPAEQYSDSNNFRYGTPGAKGANGDVGPRFVAPWTPQSALAFCTNALQLTPAMEKCQELLGRTIDLSGDIANCIRDIQITGTTDFLVTARQASKTTCLQSLRVADINPAPFMALVCPNDCSQKGTCNNGVCSCAGGQNGPDCAVRLDTPPVLTNSSAATNCSINDTISGVCLPQYVYGHTFYALKNSFPRCKITYKADILGMPTAFNVTVVNATNVSNTVVVCKLPPGSPGERVTYAISISNDGVTYSNNVTTERTFPYECGQTFVTAGTLLSPNYPSNYPNNARCVWNLFASAGLSVRLVFNAFNVENTFDVLRCYESGRLIDSFTGNLGTTITPKYYGRTLMCQFTSDASITASGFSISFTSVPLAASCGGAFTGTATLSSPGYPTPGYPNNVYCLWTLTATQGKVLKLHFNALNLETNYDFLKVYTNGALYASLTGSAVPADYVLGSTAYLVLRSDVTVTASGFSILMTSV